MKKYYAVWETDYNGNDFLLKENNKIYITENKLNLDSVFQSDNPQFYDFDCIRNMLLEGFKAIDYEQLLAFWNLTQDAANTIGYKFAGCRKKYDNLYDDVFHATNAGRIIAKDPDEIYIPQFTKNDLHNLAQILTQAFEIWTRIFNE